MKLTRSIWFPTILSILAFTACDAAEFDNSTDNNIEYNSIPADDQNTGSPTRVLNEEMSSVVIKDIPTNCAFDALLQGSSIGNHIGNMTFKDSNNENYSLHYDCGGDAKAVWIFLSTGWCGACNAYAKTVEQFYNNYKDVGLRVVWIVGEDASAQPITKDTFAEYVITHAPMSFTIVRDPKFHAVYSYLDNTTPALPHQYILDAKNMEMVFKYGGTGDSDDPDNERDGEAKIKEVLGVQ